MELIPILKFRYNLCDIRYVLGATNSFKNPILLFTSKFISKYSL